VKLNCLFIFLVVYLVFFSVYKYTICLDYSGSVTSYCLLVSVYWLEHLPPTTGHSTRRFVVLMQVSVTVSKELPHYRMCHLLQFSLHY